MPLPASQIGSVKCGSRVRRSRLSRRGAVVSLVVWEELAEVRRVEGLSVVSLLRAKGLLELPERAGGTMGGV